MKKITALLGILGVVSLFSGCASDSSSPSQPTDQSQTSSASKNDSSNAGTSSASTAKSSNSNGSQTTTPDTTVIHETVTVPTEKGDYNDPYFLDSEVFCWSAECEASWNSSASQSSSSSAASIEINMSSSEPTPPLVSGNQMIDQRDQKSYKIADLAGKKWMVENINYQTRSGYFCKTESSDDMCATYGGFYTYAAALTVCPDGWRLPTEAEVSAVDAAVDHEWWQVGGRFKLTDDKATDYGLEDEQGYIWIQANGEYSSFRVKNYGGDDNLHEFQTGTSGERAYNVRCVQN